MLSNTSDDIMQIRELQIAIKLMQDEMVRLMPYKLFKFLAKKIMKIKS